MKGKESSEGMRRSWSVRRKKNKNIRERQRQRRRKNMCMALSDDVFELLLSFSKSRVSCVCPKIFSSYACFSHACHRCRNRRRRRRCSSFASRSSFCTKRIRKRKKDMEGKKYHENIQRFSKQIYVLRHVFNCLKCTFHLYSVSVSSTCIYNTMKMKRVKWCKSV